MSESETPIRLLAIQTNETSGFYLAWVPDGLTDDQVSAALAELGIEPQLGIEIGDWRTSSQNVMAAYVPYPPHGLGEGMLEPSRS